MEPTCRTWPDATFSGTCMRVSRNRACREIARVAVVYQLLVVGGYFRKLYRRPAAVRSHLPEIPADRLFSSPLLRNARLTGVEENYPQEGSALLYGLLKERLRLCSTES